MATIINFQKKAKGKEENNEINNNSDSLVCDMTRTLDSKEKLKRGAKTISFHNALTKKTKRK